ncbi:UDP-N-acetylglucosamine--LPS N-acetylglucosamine transferase [Paenibacillus sp. P96]|uniref:UDP-N-acetylglucosamine--LPS N-acetylglucosamine transferase n=1 Tax=Paenibacillus zeirhizosphaerae TaxID=2987519 RepID=A0ABT9FW77_9BACL|nr:glycosyltransferase [Paenibacillus sp. P96]MDP4098965.1 UDP-N-acetylglucosamine--LPS N-acetylglucosamine transferase [Paenibacillus sp. P96]
MSSKKFLILSEGFGTGHTRAAAALADGLHRLYPGVGTQVMELGRMLNPKIAPVIFSAYRKTVYKQPKMIGRLYRRQYHKRLNGLTRMALHKLFYTRALRVIGGWEPDAIICTHPFPSAVVARLKRLGLNIPLYTLITDYDVHGAWISQEVNQYLVSSPQAEEMLRAHGVEKYRISVTGIPVHPDFWNCGDKPTARARFGFHDMPTVLVMGGGWGIPLEESMMNVLIRMADQIQVILCTGNNDKLFDKLTESPKFRHPHLHVLGFTRAISTLMDAADLLITKPGGMTCTEAMAKDLSMLFVSYLPGQEEENCDFFVKNGCAKAVTHPVQLEQSLRNELLNIQDKKGSARPTRTSATSDFRYDPLCCPATVFRLTIAASVRDRPELVSPGAAELSAHL